VDELFIPSRRAEPPGDQFSTSLNSQDATTTTTNQPFFGKGEAAQPWPPHFILPGRIPKIGDLEELAANFHRFETSKFPHSQPHDHIVGA
jgi:hypothetical protein